MSSSNYTLADVLWWTTSHILAKQVKMNHVKVMIQSIMLIICKTFQDYKPPIELLLT